VEDDYYDDYDDDDEYYEDEDEDVQQVNESYNWNNPEPPRSKTTPGKTTTTINATILPAQKPASKAIPSPTGLKMVSSSSVGGVTKPPPGWGKPSTTPSVSKRVSKTTSSSSDAVGVRSGVAKPPPGWGAPTNTRISSESDSVPSKSNHRRSKSPKSKPNLGATTIIPASCITTTTTTTTKATTSTSYTPREVPDFVRNSKSQLSMVVLYVKTQKTAHLDQDWRRKILATN
jgi:hypothetical protein